MKLIRYLFEALFLLILFVISKMLPVHWASNMGGWIGRTVGVRLAASRKALTNIRNAFPDKTDAQAHEILRGMWDNLGRTMMEYPHLAHIGRDRTEIIGKEILDKYKDSPAILFTAHMANWEVCPIAALTQENFKVTSVYRAPNNPFSDKMLLRARTLNGQLQTIPKSRGGTRELVKALQNNVHIGMLIDQKYNEGIEADFFNQPAMTSPAFVQLAQKFECPLIPLKIERLENARFRMTIFDPLEIKGRAVDDIVAQAHGLLESWISDRPSEWLWLHRRWNTVKNANKENTGKEKINKETP